MSQPIVAKPGTPGARFTWLLNELEKRFPDEQRFSAAPPEGRYLAAIDLMVAKTCDKLVHQVTVDDWAHVARVMVEYKKKKHAQFYLHVDELAEGYCVQVFKKVTYD